MPGQMVRESLVAVDHKEFFPREIKEKRRVLDSSQGLQDLFQPPALTVAIAEHGPQRAAGFFQLPGGEGRHKVAGMDDQLAAQAAEQVHGPAEGGQVIVRISQNSNFHWTNYNILPAL